MGTGSANCCGGPSRGVDWRQQRTGVRGDSEGLPIFERRETCRARSSACEARAAACGRFAGRALRVTSRAAGSGGCALLGAVSVAAGSHTSRPTVPRTLPGTRGRFAEGALARPTRAVAPLPLRAADFAERATRFASPRGGARDRWARSSALWGGHCPEPGRCEQRLLPLQRRGLYFHFSDSGPDASRRRTGVATSSGTAASEKGNFGPRLRFRPSRRPRASSSALPSLPRVLPAAVSTAFPDLGPLGLGGSTASAETLGRGLSAPPSSPVRSA